MNCVIGEHPPTHVAPFGSLWQDRDGLSWQQISKEYELGTLGGTIIRGGIDWQVFSPHGLRTGIMWSSDNLDQLVASASPISHSFSGAIDETDGYHTQFPIRRTFRVKGLVLPVFDYRAGVVDVKVGLYVRRTTCEHWSNTLADSRLLFSMLNTAPIASPFLIPFDNAMQDGLILRKGCDLFVRAVWGSFLEDTTIMARFPADYNNSGDNFFRADRKTSLDSDFTLDIADLMAADYSGSFGTTADNMAKIDWGMYGDFLD